MQLEKGTAMKVFETELAAAMNRHQHEQTAAGMQDMIYDRLTELGYQQEIAKDVAETAARRFLELTSSLEPPCKDEPAYARLMQDISNGTVDTVVCR